uniref:Uncharacterized protein n=1 Tax=Streptomyces sp. WT6 TaxID=1486372 RepID=A0A023PXY0_9ACTN|nr:hypothetical protein wt6.33c [Streptomyces sp. WT6]
MNLKEVKFTDDNSQPVPTRSLESTTGPGMDGLADTGYLTARNPNIHVTFTPSAAGTLRYVVRIGANDPINYGYIVTETQVGSPVTIWGVAHFDFNSPSARQACEISLELDESWLIAKF